MSSDNAYEEFLKKSQKDYSGGHETPMASVSIKAEGDPHPAIKNLGDRFYTSETDEPFEGITFDWPGKSIPTAGEFADLVGVSSDAVGILGPRDWDRQGRYKDVVDAVSTACGSAVKVYRVEGSGARVEYYVSGLDDSHGRVIGVRVKAVES